MLNLGSTTDPTSPDYSRGLTLDGIWFKDSAYWTILIRGDNIRIGFCNVTVRASPPGVLSSGACGSC